MTLETCVTKVKWSEIFNCLQGVAENVYLVPQHWTLLICKSNPHET